MAKGDFDLRRGDPGVKIDYTDAQGNQRSIRADDDGVLSPKDAAEVAILDLYELPVARSAMEEAKKSPGGRKPTATRGKSAAKKVLVAETGQEDTRGPGAPAHEPGVTDVKEG